MEWKDVRKLLWVTGSAVGPIDLFLKYSGSGRGLMLAQLIQTHLCLLTYEVVTWTSTYFPHRVDNYYSIYWNTGYHIKKWKCEVLIINISHINYRSNCLHSLFSKISGRFTEQCYTHPAPPTRHFFLPLTALEVLSLPCRCCLLLLTEFC